ncbi:hypothetical protein [Peredibacter starrii]|uniref:Uncharacterized protein n=1 Tax=Peredibacter starrii TaxID=28202 RepID=A0AAX4HW07_9BACT|nr:hypothetical protein [Peredibacter starrii]WPU67194.1 hypothetical protein SOO65_10550 [Peredibacter starrii]
MSKITIKDSLGGKLEIFKDYGKHLFLARPHGFINPDLLDEDLKNAKEFSQECPDHWTYCTNTEDVRLINPFNILFLKEIKKLQKLKEIVVYAPGSINRLLIRLITPIFQPDRVIKNKKEFQLFLEEVH